jgi:hypothetical protein
MTDLFFAEVHDSASLREALRQRVEQLNISRSCLDYVSKLTPGYAAKLLAPNGKKGVGALSLDLLLPAVGLKIVLVDDRDALARVQPMFEPRVTYNVRLSNDSRKNPGRRNSKKRSYRGVEVHTAHGFDK